MAPNVVSLLADSVKLLKGNDLLFFFRGGFIPALMTFTPAAFASSSHSFPCWRHFFRTSFSKSVTALLMDARRSLVRFGSTHSAPAGHQRNPESIRAWFSSCRHKVSPALSLSLIPKVWAWARHSALHLA